MSFESTCQVGIIHIKSLLLLLLLFLEQLLKRVRKKIGIKRY